METKRQKGIATLSQPHLVELYELLEILERLQQANSCSRFEAEYMKAAEDICGGENPDLSLWFGETGTLVCFRCVFAHYGLELPDFGQLDRTTQVRRFRELLGAYQNIDQRLRFLLQGCEDKQQLDTASVIDYLLGEGLLTIQYDSEGDFAYAVGTETIAIPESQFQFFEESGINVDDPDYQTIAFLLAHELGHIFHNRLQEMIYKDQENESVTLIMPDGTEREVDLPADTPRAVRDYLQAVGGYYTLERDFNPPARYIEIEIAVPLTSLNFNGPGQPLDIYEADGKTIRSDIREGYEQSGILVQSNSKVEYVYMSQDGQAVNEIERTFFIEANTYIPSLVPDTLANAFPNELRATAEPKEGFADSFAAYLLDLPGFNDTSRFDFFDQRMQDWLCQLLQEAAGA